MPRALFTLNPRLDRARLKASFAREGRVQVRDFLTDETAEEIYQLLTRGTAWGMAWQAGESGPKAVEAPELGRAPAKHQAEINQSTYQSAALGKFAFQFARYPILNAYLDKWEEGGAYDTLLEHINAPDFLDFIRYVTGLGALMKGDAQATLFAPGQFLGFHDDGHVKGDVVVAYVMNFCKEWRPDWGGYLNFFDGDGDIVAGFKPRFNALNLFKVPHAHAVSYVPPFAPLGRFAITGWFRDR
jgi:Rps23 Pro-64 3,4-dihydroxylase Tpa1-like proline 4-hydroxylase